MPRKALRIILLYVLFVVLSVLVTMHAGDLPRDWGLGSITVADVRSFLASVWASVFVALVIGVGTAVWSIESPEKDALEQRIGYLFGRRDLPREAMEYFSAEVRRLAAITRDGHVVFRVREFDAVHNAYRLAVTCEFTLINSMNDLKLDPEARLWIRPDNVDADPLGELEEVRVWKRSDRGSDGDVTLHERPSELISKERGELELVVPLQIEPCGEVHYRYVFWAWSQSGVEWELGHDRFAANLRVQLRNDMENSNVCVRAVTDHYGRSRVVGDSQCVAPRASIDLFKNVTLAKKGSKLGIVLTPTL